MEFSGCLELLSGIAESSTKDSQTQLEADPGTEPDDASVEDVTNEQGGSDEAYDEYEADVEIDDSFFDAEYSEDYDDYAEDSYDDDVAGIDNRFDDNAEYEEDNTDVVFDYDSTDYNEDDFDTELMDDEPLEEEAVVEEEDEIADEDINIDAGFLNDDQGNSVDLPKIDTSTTTVSATQSSAAGPTFIFYFCALGGTNQNGPVREVVNRFIHY